MKPKPASPRVCASQWASAALPGASQHGGANNETKACLTLRVRLSSQVQANMAASGVIQKADFKIVYVAPMKASSSHFTAHLLFWLPSCMPAAAAGLVLRGGLCVLGKCGGCGQVALRCSRHRPSLALNLHCPTTCSQLALPLHPQALAAEVTANFGKRLAPLGGLHEVPCSPPYVS